MALTDKLTAIADAIRGKTGGTDALTLDGMVSAIEGISGGGATGEITATTTYATGAQCFGFFNSIGETGTCIYIRPDWAEIDRTSDLCFACFMDNGTPVNAVRWRTNANVPGFTTSAVVNIPEGTVFVRLEV